MTFAGFIKGAACGTLIASGLAVLTASTHPQIGVLDIVVGVGAGIAWVIEHRKEAA